MWISLTLLLCAFKLRGALSQSNYASHGNSIEYQPGLPPSTVLDGKVTKLDDIQPIIFLNRTKAYLNCGQGSMEVELKFEEPFYGLAYADFDRNTACMVKGRGLNHTILELPLKGCGTKQDAQRVFTNNIVVRFHPGLEMDGDEVITIVCRYPPPVTPKQDIIGAGPYRGMDTPVLLPDSEPPLKGFQILLTICALLFLSLLLLGLGCSYLCMKRRNVRVVHRQQFGSGTGSEITKLSGSSLGNISMFEGLKIPRAHTLLHAAPSSSGSEVNLVIDRSDTLPSDYPSESHSEVGIEVDEVRSLPVSSAGSYDNKAFSHQQTVTQQIQVRASSSIYSEPAVNAETSAMTSASASGITLPRHSEAVPMEPKFDVQMRVKRAPPQPPSPLTSESDASIALERNLTTILEREESARSRESPIPRMTTFSCIPELHGPASNTISRQQTPPVYSRILRKQAERENYTNETGGSPTSGERPIIHGPRLLTTLTEFSETQMLTEVMDSSHAKYRVANILAPTPPPPPPITPSSHVGIKHREIQRENSEPLVEAIVATRRPEITTHEVDDVFLRTVTEKKTIEDVERHRRQVTEYYARPKPQPDPKWDVTIRNYPTEELPPPPPEWENFSDVSSASNLTITNEPIIHRPNHIHPDIDATIYPTYNVRVDIPSRSGCLIMATDDRDSTGSDCTRSGNNFFSLARVLEPRYATELTDDERRRWRDIITSDSTLRTLLTEAVVKEDYELIRKDARYTTLFPPTKWDVIIRILSPSPGSTSSSLHWKGGQHYKRNKSSEWDSRSRRSSLPTLYEYESDGGSTSRTNNHLRDPGDVLPPSDSHVRRLSSTMRAGSETDLRSMSETTRDFVRVERDDLTSLNSFEADSFVRSLSQPSIGRSVRESASRWACPTRVLPTWGNEDTEPSSSETTPLAARRGDRVEIMASFDSGTGHRLPGISTSFARSTRYTESESVRVTDGPRSSWFHDDSEPEMQI